MGIAISVGTRAPGCNNIGVGKASLLLDLNTIVGAKRGTVAYNSKARCA